MTRMGRSRGARWTIALLALLALGVVIWGGVIEPARLVERDHVLRPAHWPAKCDGLRLDVVADTHTGSPRNGLDNLDRVIDRLLASDSDAVMMAGDYVILSVFLGTYVPPERIAERLRRLTAHKPVFAVLGNHDWWKDGPRVRRAFESAGIVVLQNQSRTLQVRGCRFWIAGIGDLLEGHPDIAGTLAQANDDAPVLVLTHEPASFSDIPPRVALTIAGHTHGGQIDLWPFRSEASRFFPHSHFLKWHIVDRGRHLFVSPGIGTSIVPMRIGVPPEISRLTLRSAAVSP